MGGGQTYFRDPLHLLNHLRNELLPICDSTYNYEFFISFLSHEASATDIIDSILQMPPINSSTNVKFDLYHPNTYGETLTRLPIDAVSAWLDRPNDVIMKCKRQQNTPLKLDFDVDGVQNTQELLDHFKEVHFAYLKNHSARSDSDPSYPKHENFKAGGYGWR